MQGKVRQSVERWQRKVLQLWRQPLRSILHIQQRSQVMWNGQWQEQRERQEKEQKPWKEDELWEPTDSHWHEPQWESDSEVWETTTDSARLRCLDLLMLILYLRTRRNHPITRNTRVRSGSSSIAAATALPVELADGLPLYKVGEIIVANGQEIPNFGRGKCQTVDEFGNECKMEDMSQKYTNHLTQKYTTISTAMRSSWRIWAPSFPDTAELQKAYEGSIIDCVRFMVIMEFYFCIMEECCTIAT